MLNVLVTVLTVLGVAASPITPAGASIAPATDVSQLGARPLAAVSVAEDTNLTKAKLDTAVFAGGCFWGVEAVFEHVKGATNVISGYAGGDQKSATYAEVSRGQTKHAEAVRVVYDPSVVSYGELLRVFFSIAHDPTQLNRQGPDAGSQYRSVIFYLNQDQERAAARYIAQVTEAKTFSKPIVTQVVALPGFYAAESYHQDFAERNPTHPYILAYDKAKVDRLKQLLPEMYRD